MRLTSVFAAALLTFLAFGCSADDPRPELREEAAAGDEVKAPEAAAPESATLPKLPPDKPLYAMNEAETDRFIQQMHREHDDLRRRTAAIARANLDQPYEIYLLGEAPFETIDPQPVYCLDRSDCVTFVEHTLAMALSEDWDSFMTMLQRIRYADGRVGVRTRNHYTEGDWDPNNQWLAYDVSRELAGEAADSYPLKIDRAKFFKDRYEIDVDVPVEELLVDYVPLDAVESISSELKQGDIIQFVRGRIGDYGQPGGLWIGHFGMVVTGENGATNVIHSAGPKVREQALSELVSDGMTAERTPGKVRLVGFKILRLNEDAMAALGKIDGPDAPRVTLPDGSPFDPGDVPPNPPTTNPVTAAGGR